MEGERKGRLLGGKNNKKTMMAVLQSGDFTRLDIKRMKEMEVGGSHFN